MKIHIFWTDISGYMSSCWRAMSRREGVDVRVAAYDSSQATAFSHSLREGVNWVPLNEADRFDAVVCQFGAMFFPDRVAGYREARRVLKPGGRFIFSIWDGLAQNPVARCVVDAAARHLPANPPRFLARTPHGHSDRTVIRREVAEAGFTQIALEVVALPSRARSHRDPAIGFCQGSPMRGEIEAVAPRGLEEATDAIAAALASEFGKGPLQSTMQAIVIVARK